MGGENSFQFPLCHGPHSSHSRMLACSLLQIWKLLTAVRYRPPGTTTRQKLHHTPWQVLYNAVCRVLWASCLNRFFKAALLLGTCLTTCLGISQVLHMPWNLKNKVKLPAKFVTREGQITEKTSKFTVDVTNGKEGEAIQNKPCWDCPFLFAW